MSAAAPAPIETIPNSMRSAVADPVKGSALPLKPVVSPVGEIPTPLVVLVPRTAVLGGTVVPPRPLSVALVVEDVPPGMLDELSPSTVVLVVDVEPVPAVVDVSPPIVVDVLPPSTVVLDVDFGAVVDVSPPIVVDVVLFSTVVDVPFSTVVVVLPAVVVVLPAVVVVS